MNGISHFLLIIPEYEQPPWPPEVNFAIAVVSRVENSHGFAWSSSNLKGGVGGKMREHF